MPEARQYAAQLTQAALPQVNWQVAGVRLLDLEQVDNDLFKWTQ